MATLCLRRLCTRNSPIFRQFYDCKTLAAATPVFFNHEVSVPKLSNLNYLSGRTVLQPSPIIIRCYSDKIHVKIKPDKEPPEKKLSLLQRFKQMYRDYWYVLVPVHLVTSAAWFGGFYYLAKSGVDIAGLLESWNVSEKITNSLRDSSMGYIAVAYACYKIATPLRYTVTLGGTTISISYLKQLGYIKPVPSKDQLKEMYKERKENIMETYKEQRENIMDTIKETRGFYKEKKDGIMGSVSGTKLQLKLQKDQLKNKKEIIVDDSLKKIKKVKEALDPKPEEIIKITKKNGS